jgi:hypothetical protein
MSGALEDYVLPIHCPKCGASIEKTVGWLRDNNELVCHCGTMSHLEPAEVIAAAETLDDTLRRIVRPTPGAEKSPV